MALSTALIHSVRGRPPLLAAGIKSLIHSHSSSVRSLGYVFSFIYPCYTTHEDFSDRLLGLGVITATPGFPRSSQSLIPLGLPFRTRRTMVDVYGELFCGNRCCQWAGM